MEFDTQFWIQIIIYALTFGMCYGKITTRLGYLEKKMDKHNQLQDRMAVVEQSVKSAHHRLDDLRQDVKEEIKQHEN